MANLQSSPPTRAWEKPGSPEGSQYSLDLGALDLDSHSGTSTPLPRPHVEKVLSEDIDGPSDFTVNMEKWMRGGTLPKRRTRSASGVDYAIPEERQENGDKSMDDVLESPKDEEGPPDQPTISNHTPNESLPGDDHGYHAEQQDGDVQPLHLDQDVQNSSTWNPYASTPHPKQHNHPLQPTVEDYYSELLPTKPVSSHRAISQKQSKTVEEERAAPSKPFSPGRPSSPTLSPVRSPVIVRSNIEEAPHPDVQRLQAQLAGLQTKCHQLELVNSTLTKALEGEKQARERYASEYEGELWKRVDVYETKLRDASRREQDLVEMKEAAHRHNDDFRTEFSQLKERLQLRDNENQMLRKADDDQESLIQSMKKKLEEERLCHERELKQLSLEQAERKERIADLEKQTATHRRNEESARQAAMSDDSPAAQEAENERLRREETQVHHLAKTISDLRDQLEGSLNDFREIGNAKRDAEQEVRNVQQWRQDQRSSEDGKSTKLLLDKQEAFKIARGLHAELKELKEKIRDEKADHEHTIDNLRADLESAKNADTDELCRLRVELNSTIIKRDFALDEAKTIHAELEEVRTELEEVKAAHHEINHALDEKLSAVISRRERAWEEKFDYLRGERAQMAKELLRCWGKDEVGKGFDGALQPYEYKFVSNAKSSKKADLRRLVREKHRGAGE